MPLNPGDQLASVLKAQEDEVLKGWLLEQSSSAARRDDLISMGESQEQSRRFLNHLQEAIQTGVDFKGEGFRHVRDILGELSRSRARQGFTASQVANFVFSLKKPIFAVLQRQFAQDPETLLATMWAITELLDNMGLETTEVYQKGREEIIARQQQEMLELSTPVVKLWDGVLALPLIGTLDSARTQVVMESLLEKIVSTGSQIAIIDITGVPTVDTLVAQHLMKTVAAARLMGADCIISGIRPQIAQTIVHLGVELKDITTKASLAGAFTTALTHTGYVVKKANRGSAGSLLGTSRDRDGSTII